MDLRILQAYAGQVISVIYFLFVPAVIAIAFITLLWGIYKFFILNADDEAERAKGKQFILWGIIGLAAIVSVWGLVWMAIYIIGIGPGPALPIPMI
ncbi:MAG: hypothetical protein G01um101449_56 [Parcubacteria group bacterium Gr01-1014_49]|nr:MAG: hypothetical protein G01um101449_56 [Parcubacteria group bacterium Gr01-1014_49]